MKSVFKTNASLNLNGGIKTFQVFSAPSPNPSHSPSCINIMNIADNFFHKLTEYCIDAKHPLRLDFINFLCSAIRKLTHLRPSHRRPNAPRRIVLGLIEHSRSLCKNKVQNTGLTGGNEPIRRKLISRLASAAPHFNYFLIIKNRALGMRDFIWQQNRTSSLLAPLTHLRNLLKKVTSIFLPSNALQRTCTRSTMSVQPYSLN